MESAGVYRQEYANRVRRGVRVSQLVMHVVNEHSPGDPKVSLLQANPLPSLEMGSQNNDSCYLQRLLQVSSTRVEARRVWRWRVHVCIGERCLVSTYKAQTRSIMLAKDETR